MRVVLPLTTSSNYNIKNISSSYSKPVHSIYNGTESLSNLAPKTWELVPNNTKALDSLSELTDPIKLWKPLSCSCRICKTYIPQVCFV